MKISNILLFWIITLIATHVVDARAVRSWTYDELLSASDVVAIIRPVSNVGSDDKYPGKLYYFSQDDFAATNTSCELLGLLKGTHASKEPLIIRHFNYSDNVDVIMNGARFISFAIGPLQFTKQILKNEEVIGGVTVYQELPVWIGFLRKLDDGRYEGVTDAYDSADSFRELHQASFFTP